MSLGRHAADQSDCASDCSDSSPRFEAARDCSGISTRPDAPAGSISHFYIASRRILDGQELVAARRARRDFCWILILDPFEPVGPPGSRILLSSLDPLVERSFGRSTRPIAVLLHCGWIDDAGNMAGACEHVSERPAKELRAEENRLCRSNMVFASREVIDRNLDLVQLERPATDHHFALGELVLKIAIAQIERVISGWHTGRVRIPIQQIEGEWGLSFEIVVDNVRPD